MNAIPADLWARLSWYQRQKLLRRRLDEHRAFVAEVQEPEDPASKPRHRDCPDCGTPIWVSSKRCRPCAAVNQHRNRKDAAA